MLDSKQEEGFVILDEGKVPDEILREIKHCNGLIETFDQSYNQKKALIISENKIKKLFEKYPGIYPLYVVYGNVPLIAELLQTNQKNPSQFIDKLKKIRKIEEKSILKS